MDCYAVIGNPIGHSKSPTIHRAFAAQAGEAIQYVAIAGRAGHFAAEIDARRTHGLRGLNVTAPFKLDAFAYATALQPDARLAGAVNCLAFDGDQAIGANFDGVGLVADLTRNLGLDIKGRRLLLLGAGGAARGALLPLLQQEPAALVLANRTAEKALALGAEFAGHRALATGGLDALADGNRDGFDIVINATSASFDDRMPAVARRDFSAGLHGV